MKTGRPLKACWQCRKPRSLPITGRRQHHTVPLCGDCKTEVRQWVAPALSRAYREAKAIA